MSSSGWLTTKKRGRDDAVIAKDAAKALKARQQQRQRKPPSKKKKKSKPWTTKSLDDFVVNDDDDDDDEELLLSDNEALEEWEEAEQEEEDEEVSDDDDDESEEEDTFFQSYKRRTSRPPPKLDVARVSRKPSADNSRKKKKNVLKRLRKDKIADMVDLCTSEEDDVAAPSKKKAAATKQQLYSLSSTDDDDDDDSLPSPKLMSYKAQASKSSRFFANNNKNHHKKERAPADALQSLGCAAPDAEQEDEEATPVQPAAIRKKQQHKTKRKRVIQELEEEEEDDDDDFFNSFYANDTVEPAAKAAPTNTNDYCSDDDEAQALALAIKESLKQQQQQGAARRVSDDTDDALADETILLDDDDDDNDNEEEDDEQDDYIDHDARAASSVLETANDLSAQVLTSMARWVQSTTTNKKHDKNNSTSAANVVPMGMIVDGALALDTLESDCCSSNDDHTWISQQDIKEICPNVTLADYQLIGVNWLALLNGMTCQVEGSNVSTNVNGVLADEMGLGKTVQTIAFLSWLKHRKQDRKPSAKGSKGDAIVLDDDDDDSVVFVHDTVEADSIRPHLVVAPASVLSNWELEFNRFAPDLNVVKYHGSRSDRLDLQHQLELHLPGKESLRRLHSVDPVDVILTPITYFQKEKSDDRSFLRKFKYDYMIVDEAHLLKNARGTRYKTLDRFSTMHRLLLTGTPVQNSPKELMSLLCFLMPLFSRKSAEAFDGSKENDGGESMLQHFVSLEGGNGASDAAAYRKLKQLFAPFVLRRKKQDVLSQIMPPKERTVEYVELDSTARSLYDLILSDHIKAKKKGDALSREHLFTQLRKAAHHPLLIRARHKSPAEKEHLADCFHRYGAFQGEACTKAKVAEEVDRYNDFQIHVTALELIEENPLRSSELERYTLEKDDLYSSAKFVRLRSLLPLLIEEGHRILVFSVWTSCLDLLGCLMEQLDLEYLRMDGSTPVHERQSLIDKFNSDSSIPVFLLSTKACGLGINLTSADICLMHDIDFNPFNDLQAEDRCHRIGQKKPVKVIKMITKDTVDEDIYAMQQRKAQMNAAIMESGSESKDNAAKKKEEVLKTAVDRFLRSPNATMDAEKENTVVERDAI